MNHNKLMKPDFCYQRDLITICEHLRKSTPTKTKPETLKETKRILSDGLCYLGDVENWLDSFHGPLGTLAFDLGLATLCKLADVKPISRFEMHSDGSAYGIPNCVRPEEFATILIHLEDLGFDTHPEDFYTPFIEQIKAQKYFSTHDVTCLHRAKKEHKLPVVTYLADLGLKLEKTVTETIKGINGLTIEILRAPEMDGPVKSLKVYRFRKDRPEF